MRPMLLHYIAPLYCTVIDSEKEEESAAAFFLSFFEVELDLLNQLQLRKNLTSKTGQTNNNSAIDSLRRSIEFTTETNETAQHKQTVTILVTIQMKVLENRKKKQHQSINQKRTLQ